MLDNARMALAKPDMAVLHPLPRVNEILPEPDMAIVDHNHHCSNAKCICNNEGAPEKFRVSDDGSLRCWYCDSKAR